MNLSSRHPEVSFNMSIKLNMSIESHYLFISNSCLISECNLCDLVFSSFNNRNLKPDDKK